jgi:SAM-dependent methyltransferase
MPRQALALEQLDHCPICGAHSPEAVLSQPDGYLPQLHLQRCRECHIVYLDPRLTLDSIIKVEDESEVYTFDQSVAEQWISDVFTTWVAQFEGYIQGPGRRLLDIGCNRGFLMESARRRGWQVTGVEISPESAKRARHEYGLTVYADMSEIAADARFDLITAWHVLEHMLDPVAFLRQASDRLQPNGVLALQVPCFDYLEEFRARDQLGSVLCAVHNFYFTEDNLQSVLGRVGLGVEQIDSNPTTLLLTAICRKPATRRSWRQQISRWLGRTS